MLLKIIAISTECKRNTSEVIIWRTTSAGYTIFPFSARGGRALMPKRSGEGARFLGGDASPTPAGFISKGKLNHKFHQKDKKSQKYPSQIRFFFCAFSRLFVANPSGFLPAASRMVKRFLATKRHGWKETEGSRGGAEGESVIRRWGRTAGVPDFFSGEHTRLRVWGLATPPTPLSSDVVPPNYGRRGGAFRVLWRRTRCRRCGWLRGADPSSGWRR